MFVTCVILNNNKQNISSKHCLFTRSGQSLPSRWLTLNFARYNEPNLFFPNNFACFNVFTVLNIVNGDSIKPFSDILP